jgi:hypothetical protein
MPSQSSTELPLSRIFLHPNVRSHVGRRQSVTATHDGVYTAAEVGVGAGWSVMPVRGDRAFQEVCMHGIIYLVGLVVVIMAILTLFGLR